MKNLLEIKNFNMKFKGSTESDFQINDVEINIPEGKTVAIVGESGSGKTLTALSILGLNPNTSIIQSNSQILFDKEDLIKISNDQLNQIRGNKISMVFQEPLSALNPLHTVEKQISEGMLIHKLAKKHEIRSKVIELMKKVRISDPESKLARYPHQLSGGERQRVMIAMALSNNPQLLIADEPTTALDVTIQYEILNLLKSLQEELNLAILFITHDLGIVKDFSDFVYVMQGGKVIESGIVEDIFQNPRKNYTKELVNARSLQLKKKRMNKSLEIFKVEDLSVNYIQKKSLMKTLTNNVLKEINFSINLGETVGLVGESGSGKTTIGLSILRLIKSQGKVIFMGQDFSKLNRIELNPKRKDFQIVFQDPYGSLSPRMTIGQIIEEGLISQKIELNARKRLEMTNEILQDVGLSTQHINRYPHEFSGGQRQRIAIARAIILRPKLLILDEPTSSLDSTVQLQILNLLTDLQEKYNTAYLFISHDLRVIRYMADRVFVINSGNIVESDYTENIFNRPKNDYTKKLISSALLD
jgi:microcin C transport system ATP-binding protein